MDTIKDVKLRCYRQDRYAYKYDIDCINHFLHRGDMIPRLFDDCIITVTFENSINPLELLNRKLFEDTMFIRGDIKSDEHHIYISLSEAILYINSVTPPILKGLIPESITTLDDVIDVLKTFLMEEIPFLETHIDTFKLKMNMKDTLPNLWEETYIQNNINQRRLDYLLYQSPFRESLNVMSVEYSDVPINEICSDDKPDLEFSMIGVCLVPKDVPFPKEFYKIMEDVTEFGRILMVGKNAYDTHIGFAVILDRVRKQPDRTPVIPAIIKRSYEKLLK